MRAMTTGRVDTSEIELSLVFFFQAEDGIRDRLVTGVQTCALPIFHACEGRIMAQAEGMSGRNRDMLLAHAERVALIQDRKSVV